VAAIRKSAKGGSASGGKKEPDILEIIVEAAEEKQAINLKILDVAKTSPVVDFIVIGSGDSEPQLRAIAKEVDSELRKHDIKNFRWEGVPGSGWLVLDLGNIVIHLLNEEQREYYKLEELWGKEAIVYHY
jgi:ribosome-associated protein